ncbi:uncharacterized protein LAESUDRAFT_715817 [Laetiporus sulphureus 93-53]|uniref:Uncharacterized protein n=1 Tax=Laetiporus sulphureus 93-53 TaxID=1314785 RepID=A0A165D3X3_9APHY|nr:uncharacterized protein LAESUDRAFT_715817 [Laetiporus sulphureus 93-53]KZT04108.1 hypothetical protein LAESUDRAFT_715817 [Laetiporus sulphureus 93-53]
MPSNLPDEAELLERLEDLFLSAVTVHVERSHSGNKVRLYPEEIRVLLSDFLRAIADPEQAELIDALLDEILPIDILQGALYDASFMLHRSLTKWHSLHGPVNHLLVDADTPIFDNAHRSHVSSDDSGQDCDIFIGDAPNLGHHHVVLRRLRDIDATIAYLNATATDIQLSMNEREEDMEANRQETKRRLKRIDNDLRQLSKLNTVTCAVDAISDRVGELESSVRSIRKALKLLQDGNTYHTVCNSGSHTEACIATCISSPLSTGCSIKNPSVGMAGLSDAIHTLRNSAQNARDTSMRNYELFSEELANVEVVGDSRLLFVPQCLQPTPYVPMHDVSVDVTDESIQTSKCNYPSQKPILRKKYDKPQPEDRQHCQNAPVAQRTRNPSRVSPIGAELYGTTPATSSAKTSFIAVTYHSSVIDAFCTIPKRLQMYFVENLYLPGSNYVGSYCTLRLQMSSISTLACACGALQSASMLHIGAFMIGSVTILYIWDVITILRSSMTSVAPEGFHTL